MNLSTSVSCDHLSYLPHIYPEYSVSWIIDLGYIMCRVCGVNV